MKNNDLKESFDKLNIRKKSEERILAELEKAYLASERKGIVGNVVSFPEKKRIKPKFKVIAAVIFMLIVVSPIVKSMINSRPGSTALTQSTESMNLAGGKSAAPERNVADSAKVNSTLASDHIKNMVTGLPLTAEVVSLEGKKTLKFTLKNLKEDPFTVKIYPLNMTKEQFESTKKDQINDAQNTILHEGPIIVLPGESRVINIDVSSIEKDKNKTWYAKIIVTQGESIKETIHTIKLTGDN